MFGFVVCNHRETDRHRETDHHRETDQQFSLAINFHSSYKIYKSFLQIFFLSRDLADFKGLKKCDQSFEHIQLSQDQLELVLAE